MNSLEKRVWAAAFVQALWPALGDIDKVTEEIRAAPDYKPSYYGIEDKCEAQEECVRRAIRSADIVVRMLRARVKRHGVLHEDEDLELERLAEEDVVGSATEDVIVEIGADVPGGDSLRCIKACEAVMARFPGLTAYVGAPPGTKVSSVTVKDEVAERFGGLGRELGMTINGFMRRGS